MAFVPVQAAFDIDQRIDDIVEIVDAHLNCTGLASKELNIIFLQRLQGLNKFLL